MRDIIFENIENARDLGGIPTSVGTHVRRGCFYRSANLDGATENDVKMLKSLGLKCVFDFRGNKEYTDSNTVCETSPYARIGVERLNFDIARNSENVMKLQAHRRLRDCFVKVSLEDVAYSYRLLPFDNEGYRAMVKAMTDGRVPFLQHCSAGKDRTGVGVMIILGILGVDFSEIKKDYLISRQVRPYVIKMLGSRLPRIIRGTVLRNIEPMLGVEEELIAAAWNEIIKRYSDFENYARCEFGLTDEDIAKLRAQYTE